MPSSTTVSGGPDSASRIEILPGRTLQLGVLHNEQVSMDTDLPPLSEC